MRHSYDLLLQPEKPGDPPPLATLVDALTRRGAALTPEGRGTWKLPTGEVEVTPLFEEGATRGLDLHVPMLDRTDHLEAVAKQLIEVAEETKTRVMDPQRSDVVTFTSLGGAVDEYLRMARYAGEYGGVSEALGLSTYARPLPEDSSTTRWLLMLGAFLLAMYVTWRAVSSWQARTAPDEAPAEMNAPPKSPGR